MVNAARKYNRVTQVGTQQRSMPINNWASDLVKNGALGKVLTVIAPNFVGPDPWTDQPAEPMPTAAAAATGGTCGPTRPCCGPTIRDSTTAGTAGGTTTAADCCFGVTGWGTHSYDQINRALGTDDTGPVEILLEEPVARSATRASSPAKTRRRSRPRRDGRRRHRHGLPRHGEAHRPAGQGHHEVRQRHGTASSTWTATAARAWARSSSARRARSRSIATRSPAIPKELVRSPDNPGPNKRPETAYHIENWIECIKSRKPLQRRHRDRPAGHHALLPGEHRPRRRPGGREARTGTRRPNDSPTATRPTSSSRASDAKDLNCPKSKPTSVAFHEHEPSVVRSLEFDRPAARAAGRMPRLRQRNSRPGKGPLEGVSLRLAVVDDPGLATAADRLRGEWNAQTGATLEVVKTTEKELDARRVAAGRRRFVPVASHGRAGRAQAAHARAQESAR